MEAKRAEQVVLTDPVVDAIGDAQRFLVTRFRLLEVAREQRGAAEVEVHHVQRVEVAHLPAHARTFGGNELERFEIASVQGIERPRLQHADLRRHVVELGRQVMRQVQEALGRGAVAGHRGRDRRHGQGIRQLHRLTSVACRGHGLF